MAAENNRFVRAITALALIIAGPASAATLVDVVQTSAGLGAGTFADAQFVTGAENNDSSPGGPASGQRDLRNTLTVDAGVGPLTGPGAYIDLIFTVETVFDGTTGITEYAVTQSLLNNTGDGVAGVRWQLGFGTGAVFLANPSTENDGLSFDQELGGLDTPLPSSDAFSFCDICSDSNRIVLNGGALPDGQSAEIEFQLDIPDLFFDNGGLNIPDDFLLPEDELTGFAGGYTFTLRQTPVPVPAPASAWLLASALTLLPWLRRQASRR